MDRYERITEAAKKVRFTSLDMAMTGANEGAHLGTSFSMAELMSCVFMELMDHGPGREKDIDRDRFLLSKGHGCLPYYILLQECGYYDNALLKTFEQFDSMLAGHPVAYDEVGVEFSTGSLGHGFPLAIGLAEALKRLNSKGKVFVMIGDGETNEGSMWEAVMYAAHRKLDNLYVILDRNRQQSDGASKDIIELNDVASKWRAFDWEVAECDGHSIPEILDAFETKGFPAKRPFVLVAKTVKGKGFDLFEDNPDWHHNILKPEVYEAAREELTKRYGGLN